MSMDFYISCETVLEQDTTPVCSFLTSGSGDFRHVHRDLHAFSWSNIWSIMYALSVPLSCLLSSAQITQGVKPPPPSIATAY